MAGRHEGSLILRYGIYNTFLLVLLMMFSSLHTTTHEQALALYLELLVEVLRQAAGKRSHADFFAKYARELRDPEVGVGGGLVPRSQGQ